MQNTAPAGVQPGRGYIFDLQCTARAAGKNRRAAQDRGGPPAVHTIGFYLAPLTVSFKALPGLKAGTFAALILMASPVWGFLPVRAALLRVS